MHPCPSTIQVYVIISVRKVVHPTQNVLDTASTISAQRHTISLESPVFHTETAAFGARPAGRAFVDLGELAGAIPARRCASVECGAGAGGRCWWCGIFFCNRWDATGVWCRCRYVPGPLRGVGVSHNSPPEAIRGVHEPARLGPWYRLVLFGKCV